VCRLRDESFESQSSMECDVGKTETTVRRRSKRLFTGSIITSG
jgi:hypothetical protein